MLKEVAMKSHLVFATTAVLWAVCGCAEKPFVRVDPPVTSGGVTVELVGQKCGREARNEAYDVLDLEVALKVTNGTMAPIEVIPAEMRLLAKGNAPTPRSSAPRWESASIQIPPTGSGNVQVHFYRPGNAKCDQTMRLSFGHSIDDSGRALVLPPVAFVPSSYDS